MRLLLGGNQSGTMRGVSGVVGEIGGSQQVSGAHDLKVLPARLFFFKIDSEGEKSIVLALRYIFPAARSSMCYPRRQAHFCHFNLHISS
jgi:hypothetical protein